MEAHIRLTASHLELHLSGRLDFMKQSELREQIDELLSQAKEHSLRLNLTEVTYIDSTTLGTLLQLHHRSARPAQSIQLFGATRDVRRVLDMATFSSWFQIS